MIIKGYPPYSNTYIIKRFDQAIIIDPSYNYDEISKKTEALNIVAVLLTHADCYHMGLVGHFKCPVYMHRKEYRNFIDDNLNGCLKNNIRRSYDPNKVFVKFIEDNQTIELADKLIKAIYTPGHSDGSLSYYYDNMLFTGDFLNSKGIGTIKKVKGAKLKIKKSVEKIFKLVPAETTIYPGHGEEITLNNLKNKI